MDLISKAQELYGEYLMEMHCDTIHTKDQHIEAMENGTHFDEFVAWVNENV